MIFIIIMVSRWNFSTCTRQTQTRINMMNMMTMLLLLLLGLLSYHQSYAYRCLSEKHGAECTTPALCNPGVVVSGLCLPGSGLQCCLRGSDAKCSNLGGTCEHRSKCGNMNTRYAELCPGTSDIVCCLPETDEPPTQKTLAHYTHKSNNNNNNKLPSWKDVVENKISVLSDYLLTNMTIPDAKKQSTKLCWPVAQNSTQKKTVTDVSWGSYREHGKRCHAGVDIFTAAPGEVISIAHGQVINIIPRFTYCSRGWGLEHPHQAQPVSAIMVYYPDLGKTVNYGEMDPDKIRVRAGELVNRGTVLGLASYCGMLHFELYNGRASTFHTWRPPKNVRLPPLGNVCSVKYTNTAAFHSTQLTDPRPLLHLLEGRFCGT